MMHPIKDGYRSLTVLFSLHADLLLFGTTLSVALLATGYMLTL